MDRKNKLDANGFTLIELVIIIIVLGMIAAVVIPKYQDVASEAKESSCKDSLGALRNAVSIWYAKEVARGDDTPSFPSIDSIRAIGIVMEHNIPSNPYQTNAGDSIVTGVTKGAIVGSRGGWAYKETTGEIWPNTNGTGENNW